MQFRFVYWGFSNRHSHSHFIGRSIRFIYSCTIRYMSYRIKARVTGNREMNICNAQTRNTKSMCVQSKSKSEKNGSLTRTECNEHVLFFVCCHSHDYVTLFLVFFVEFGAFFGVPVTRTFYTMPISKPNRFNRSRLMCYPPR